MARTSFTSPDDLIEKIDEIARERHRSRSYIIYEALSQYLNNKNGSTKPDAPKKKAQTR
jgi:predicted transcriptional regulator